MPTRHPEECDLQLMQAINAGDLDAAVALYEPRATLVTDQSGQIVVGHDAIREFLRLSITLGLTMTRDTAVLRSADGDLALTGGPWRMTGTDADGTPLDLGGESREVVRRQVDGTWLFVIDNPWGAG